MTANQMLSKVRHLPPISAAALQLASLLGQPTTSNQDVIEIIKEDAVLTAKLLRACNASSLGLRERIASVDQAVLMLGHGQIHQMAMALSLQGPLTVPLPAYALQNNDLWRHSVLAAAAAELAVADGLEVGVDSSTAFTIGLLHDMGKLITSEFFTRESLIAIREHIREGATPLQAERTVLGTDHAEVGASLLYLWRLPDPIVEGVALHHQPALWPRLRVSALAAFANRMAHQAAAVQAGRTAPASDHNDLLQSLGFNAQSVEDLVSRIGQRSAVANESVILSA
jgi:putative nucleotidyltransferase with HDIG domain